MWPTKTVLLSVGLNEIHLGFFYSILVEIVQYATPILDKGMSFPCWYFSTSVMEFSSLL